MNRRIRLTVLLLLAAGAALSAGQAPAGQPPTPAQGPETPTFRVSVDYVEVDTFVTDGQGRFVRDLTRDDFEVFEDGKRQAVSAFTLVDIPIERAVRPLFAAQPLEPDVKTNARPFEGRIYIVVLDDLHVQFTHTRLVQSVVRKFIQEKLGVNDLMAVIHVGGRSDASQEFTNSKRLLLASVDKFTGKAERPATLEASERFRATGGREVGDPLLQKRGFDARNTLEELDAVSSWFGGVRGRKKSILFVSEGIEYDIEDVFGKQDATMIIDRTRDLIRSATRSNVSIYSIDPRGLTDMGDFAIELGGVDGTVAGLGPGGLRNELRLQQNSLRTLAEETGGFAVINTNSFENTFNRIVEENSSYYVLAYYPPNPKRDGKFHNIQVRVKRPGLTVRARRGYASPSGKAPAAAPGAASRLSAETREALDSPLPVSGVTMHVFAAPFKGVAPKASVLLGVEIAGSTLKLDPGAQLQLSFYAMDAKGKYQGGSTETVTLNLRPETRIAVEQTGLRTLSRLELPPGRYQLRVAASELSSKSVGSVLYDLDVPDFSKGPLVMSGLALTSPSASRLPTVRPDVELRDLLPGAPAAAREFRSDDELALFAEVYDNTAATSHKVDITTTVTADEGKVMFKTDETRDSSDLQGKSGGYGYSTRVPLKGLAPGLYVLKVEARSRLSPNPTSDRQVQIRIVEGASVQKPPSGEK
jgi:VWFA-related protein